MSDKIVLAEVNGVEITQEMIELYAKRFRIEAVESNVPGIVGSIAGWCEGKGELDAFLTDSPEGHAIFAPVRTAFFKVVTPDQAEPELSKVPFEQIPEAAAPAEAAPEAPAEQA